MRDAETLTMSAKELDRLEIIGRVVERRLTQRAAAARLGLSLRHVDRYLVTPPDQRDFQAEANKLNGVRSDRERGILRSDAGRSEGGREDK